MAEKNQKLVLAVLEFLEQSIADGSVREDDKEGIEVAIQCIGEAFGVNPSDEAQRQKLSIKPATLRSLFDVYLKTKEKIATPQSAGTSSDASKATTGAPPNNSTPSVADKWQAEQLKLKGNAVMSSKDYPGAIASYTSAIALDPTNPVYYSNRAAAHSSSNHHDEAVKDAQKAIEVDSTFVKAYHRLGHALYCLGDYEESANAFQRGLDLDPGNANLKSGRDNAKARIPSASSSESTEATPAGGDGGTPDFSEILRSLRGDGSGGGPDLGSMMQNPMFMNMAQQLMQGGGLENLMRNPAISNMMNRVQSGDMPSMAELMSDPTLRDMASKFGGGADGPPPGSA